MMRPDDAGLLVVSSDKLASMIMPVLVFLSSGLSGMTMTSEFTALTSFSQCSFVLFISFYNYVYNANIKKPRFVGAVDNYKTIKSERIELL